VEHDLCICVSGGGAKGVGGGNAQTHLTLPCSSFTSTSQTPSLFVSVSVGLCLSLSLSHSLSLSLTLISFFTYASPPQLIAKYVDQPSEIGEKLKEKFNLPADKIAEVAGFINDTCVTATAVHDEAMEEKGYVCGGEWVCVCVCVWGGGVIPRGDILKGGGGWGVLFVLCARNLHAGTYRHTSVTDQPSFPHPRVYSACVISLRFDPGTAGEFRTRSSTRRSSCGSSTLGDLTR
jgi:hypothetical protein